MVTLCNQEVLCDEVHALVLCPFNNGTSIWILNCLRNLFPHLQPSQLICLDFKFGPTAEHIFPATWLVAQSLHMVWKSRVHRKQITVATTRAKLEAGIMLLRKSRHKNAVASIENLISAE